MTGLPGVVSTLGCVERVLAVTNELVEDHSVVAAANVAHLVQTLHKLVAVVGVTVDTVTTALAVCASPVGLT